MIATGNDPRAREQAGPEHAYFEPAHVRRTYVPTDHDLLRKYVNAGDEGAFGELVERYGPVVYNAAVRQVGRSDLAEDVAQAAFILLAQKARRLDAGTILGAWLHRVTRYAAMNALRAEARRRRHERKAAEMAAAQQKQQDDLASPAKLAATSVAWGEGMRHLDAGIAGLPERDREAIVLRFLQRQSLAEVGAALGVSEEAAQMRVSRALEKLRAFYRRRGLTLTATQMGAAVGVNASIAMPAPFAASLSSEALRAASMIGTPVNLPPHLGNAASLAASAARSMAIAKARVVAGILVGAIALFLLCFTLATAIRDAREPVPPIEETRVASAR